VPPESNQGSIAPARPANEVIGGVDKIVVSLSMPPSRNTANPPAINC